MLTNLPGVFHVAAGWSLCSHSGQTLLLSSSQALEALGWGGGWRWGRGAFFLPTARRGLWVQGSDSALGSNPAPPSRLGG